MVLDQLELALAFEEALRPDTGLWYPVEVTTQQGDLLSLSLEGALSLDEGAARVDSARLQLTVDEDTIVSMPPGLRELAYNHRTHGRLEVDAQGRWDLVEPHQSALVAQVRLRDFGVAVGKWSFPVRALDASVTTSAGIVRAPGVRVDLLGGTVTGWATIDATGDARQLESRWTLGGLDVGQLMAAADGGETTLAGTLSGKATIGLDLARPDETLQGRVDASVRNGTFLILPGLRQLAKLRGKELEGRQRADVKLALHPWGMKLDELTVETPLIAVRASGRARFDGQIDVEAAIGPLQKASGGPVRDALADAGARLWQYRIVGDASDPRVTPRPLGIGN